MRKLTQSQMNQVFSSKPISLITAITSNTIHTAL